MRHSYALFLLLPLPALAQEVGHPPERSPYRDLEYRQEVSLFTGYYVASKDPAGVAPQSGPMVGARYDIRVAGPAQLTVRGAHVFSRRTIIDPREPAATRVLGEHDWGLLLADVGITLNLTGQKSIWGFVPVLSSGLGIASDTRTRADPGGYKFGTAFALNVGGGVRWVPGGRFQLRADVQDVLYNVKYPTTFYDIASDGSSVLEPQQTRTRWKHNAALTVGGSYLFFR
jgi:hypothetical protein